MAKKLFTDEDMRNAFLAGERFEKNSIDMDMDKVDEITEPDFVDWMKQEFNINIE
jgi:hypothetical protein